MLGWVGRVETFVKSFFVCFVALICELARAFDGWRCVPSPLVHLGGAPSEQQRAKRQHECANIQGNGARDDVHFKQFIIM